MLRRACGALLFSLLAAGMALAQMQGGYLDVYVAKVKPEKRAEFNAVNKKMAEINRRQKGDQWVAFETAYGDLNTVMFSSARANYDGVEKGLSAFEGALGKGLGEAGAHTLEQQFNSTLESSRTEIRQRRWDLSYNPPADLAAYAQAVGNTRWIRSAIVTIRPGHTLEFEAEMKELNAASEKSKQPGMRWISQVTTGGSPFTYVLTRLFASWSELDGGPTMQALLGDEGYQKFQKMSADSVESVEYVVLRVLPELSNPPAEVIAVAPDFWNPKPKAAAVAKLKAANADKTPAKPTP